VPFREHYEAAIKAGGDYKDENGYDHNLLEFRLKNMIHWRQQQRMAAWQRRQRTDMMGVLSHELRTPLHGVIASADLLDHSRDNLTPDQGQLVNIIMESGKYLLDLLNDVLQLSR